MISIFYTDLRKKMPRGHQSQQAVCPCNFLTGFQLHIVAQEQEMLKTCQKLLSSRRDLEWGVGGRGWIWSRGGFEKGCSAAWKKATALFSVYRTDSHRTAEEKQSHIKNTVQIYQRKYK